MNKKQTDNGQKILFPEGLRFFGKMSASSTHEIKNTLAIINENAGLLEDLLELADNGHTLSHEKLKNISGKIKKQVLRADDTLKKLNRFSHCVDNTLEIVDLQEALCFVLDFASRLIQRTGCSIHITQHASPILISSDLFSVQHLIWHAIETICYDTSHNSQIDISFGTDGETSSILFSAQILTDSNLEVFFESKRDQDLMNHLGVTIKKNYNNRNFELLWPKSI